MLRVTGRAQTQENKTKNMQPSRARGARNATKSREQKVGAGEEQLAIHGVIRSKWGHVHNQFKQGISGIRGFNQGTLG